MAPSCTLVEITTLDDPLLLPWLDLYETAFPPEERVFTSRLLSGAKTHSPYHMLAGVDEAGSLAGLAFYNEVPEAQSAFLWYLAVLPGLRGNGIGAWLYHAVLQHLDKDDRAMFLDVEIPEELRTPTESEMAARRIRFYQRLGGRLLGGIRFVQKVEEHLPTISTYLMVHPIQPMNAQAAYDTARIFLGETIILTGEPSFDFYLNQLT